jgi:acetolactate synthase I/II/III large subunit
MIKRLCAVIALCAFLLCSRRIYYAKVAQGMGVLAEGPITDPKDLGPAIARAIVKRGEPAH